MHVILVFSTYANTLTWLANNSLTCCSLQKLSCEKSLPTSYCVAISINVCLFSHQLFNIIVNHNFNPFIESLICPFWHFSWSDLPGFFLLLLLLFLFNISALRQKNRDYLNIFGGKPQKYSIKQFFSNFIKDNKYIF